MANDILPQNEGGGGRSPGGRRNCVGSDDFDDGLLKEGTVREILPKGLLKVELDDGRQILATLSGKIRKNFVKPQLGDRVHLKLTRSAPNRRAHNENTLKNLVQNILHQCNRS